MWTFKRTPLFILIILVTTACGGAYEQIEIKDYALSLDSSNPDMHHAMYRLIARFNREAGVEALRYEANPNQANSTITITSGLTERDGKVGWGQWIRETRTENHLDAFRGGQPKRISVYSMRLEFDKDFVARRMHSDSQMDQYDLYKLFAHEAGHGLQMGHDPEPESVMYFDISGKKDFDPFYERVRTFFQ